MNILNVLPSYRRLNEENKNFIWEITHKNNEIKKLNKEVEGLTIMTNNLKHDLARKIENDLKFKHENESLRTLCNNYKVEITVKDAENESLMLEITELKNKISELENKKISKKRNKK